MKKQKPMPTEKMEKPKGQPKRRDRELREQMGPWLSCPPVIDPWEDGPVVR